VPHLPTLPDTYFGASGLVVLTLLLGAPTQCPAHRDTRRERVEPPGEAIYGAAQHLADEGHTRAHVATLRYIIERYPGTRWAARARADLESLNLDPSVAPPHSP